MFTTQDIYFAIENIKNIFFKDNVFYYKYENKIQKLDYFYDTEFVYLCKFSYYLLKYFKNHNIEILSKTLICFNVITFFVINNYVIDFKKLLTTNIIKNRYSKKIYRIFFKNENLKEILFNLILEKNKKS